MKIVERLVLLIQKFSKVNAIEIQASSNIKDLKFDSLDLLEFQMAIDDEFRIEIAIDDFLKCNDINDVAVVVKNYLSRK